jgi:hypothetical protein
MRRTSSAVCGMKGIGGGYSFSAAQSWM